MIINYDPNSNKVYQSYTKLVYSLLSYKIFNSVLILSFHFLMLYGSLEIFLVWIQSVFFIHVIVYRPIINYFRTSVLLNKKLKSFIHLLYIYTKHLKLPSIFVTNLVFGIGVCNKIKNV